MCHMSREYSRVPQRILSLLLTHHYRYSMQRYTAQPLLSRLNILTLSDPMSDLVRHYDFPVPDGFFIFNPFQSNFSATRILPSSYLFWTERSGLLVIILQF
jgi:hypothetical protein